LAVHLRLASPSVLLRNHEAHRRLRMAQKEKQALMRSFYALKGAVERVASRGGCKGGSEDETLDMNSPQSTKRDLRANHPSSSSLLVGAGSGAPGPSFVVGSLT
jgi:hypothetical protein